MKAKFDIDYKQNEIVKKPIVSNNSGMVILLAFDKGMHIPTHQTNADVVVQIVEGNMEFTMNGDIQYLQAGDLLCMPPATPHSLRSIERCKMILTKLNV